MLIIECLIPAETLQALKEHKPFRISIFKKNGLKKELLKILKEKYKTFLEIPDTGLERDIHILKEHELLQITEYDKESSIYDLPPLQATAIKNLLYNTFFREYYFDFYVVKETLPIIRHLIKEKDALKIVEKIRKFEEVEKEYIRVCNGKNLKELYDNRMGEYKKDMPYLARYLSALV